MDWKTSLSLKITMEPIMRVNDNLPPAFNTWTGTFLLPFFFLLPVFLLANSPGEHQKQMDSISRSLERSTAIAEKLELYSAAASFCKRHENNRRRSDSLLQRAILIAEESGSTAFKRQAYQNYLQHCIFGQRGEKIDLVIEKLDQLLDKTGNTSEKLDALETLCLACENSGADCGMLYADKFMLLAGNQNLRDQIRANMLKGICLSNNKEWALAYSFLSKAELLVLELKDPLDPVVDRLYSTLADFYYSIKEYDLSMQYLKKEAKLRVQNAAFSELDKKYLEMEILVLNSQQDPKFPARKKTLELIDYANKHQLAEFRDELLTFYRRHLINNEDFDGLHEIYAERMPEELENIGKQSPYLQITIRAYLAESEKELGSAESYWRQALNTLAQSEHVEKRGFAHYRFGQFYLRNNMTNQAIAELEQAMDLSEKFEYQPFKEEFDQKVSALLMKAYERQGNYEASKKYTDIYHVNQDRIKERFDKDLIIQYGIQQRLIEDRKEELKSYEKKNKHRLQYWMIFIIVIIMLLVMIAVSSMTVPEWLIQMMAFFSILAMTEFVLLLIDKQVYPFTRGEPIRKFIVKVAILTILFPLHHLIEHKVTEYMLNNNIIGKPKWSKIKKALSHLWPWLSEEKRH